MDTRELRKYFANEGIKDSPCSPEAEEFGILFPKEDRERLFPINNEGEEKGINLFLSIYDRKHYTTYYLDESFTEVEEFVKVFGEIETSLSFTSDNLKYKIIPSLYSSEIFFIYENEVGAKTVGLISPTSLIKERS